MGVAAFGSHPLVEFPLLMLRRREPSITGDQVSVAMRLSTRLSGAEFALLSRPRAASGQRIASICLRVAFIAC
jgi:hypothetical protein